MIFPRLRLTIFNKQLHVEKVWTCQLYEVNNDIMTSGESSYFVPELSLNDLNNLYKQRYTYKDKYLLATPVTTYIPPEVDVFYFGVIDTVDDEYKIKVNHWNIIFDNKSVPMDEYTKASIPTGDIDGIKLGSIQMQLGHIFLGTVIHGFGYNTFGNLKDYLDNHPEAHANFRIGIDQFLSEPMAKQQLMPYAWSGTNENLLSQNIAGIGASTIKYGAGVWTPICGNIESSKRRYDSEFRIAIRNLPFGQSGVTDPTNARTTSWFNDSKTLNSGSVFDFMKKAIIEYGVVTSISIEHQKAFDHNGVYGIEKHDDASRSKIYYSLKNNDSMAPAIAKTDEQYAIVVNVGPYSNKEAMMGGKFFINSVCTDKRSNKLYINADSYYVKNIDLDYDNDQYNVCYVYCQSISDDDLYFLDRVPIPDIIVTKLSDGRYYKTFTGEYAQLMRVHGGIDYYDIWKKWPADWNDRDPRIPEKSAVDGGEYKFVSIICSKSYEFNEIENYGYHPFKAPGFGMVAWGNNWHDYMGSAEFAPAYTKVIDTLDDSQASKNTLDGMVAGPSYVVEFCMDTYNQVVHNLSQTPVIETYKCFRGLDTSVGGERDNIRDLVDLIFSGCQANINDADQNLYYHGDDVVDKSDWKKKKNVFVQTNDERDAWLGFAYDILEVYSTIAGDGRVPLASTADYRTALTYNNPSYNETFHNRMWSCLDHARVQLDYSELEKDIDAYRDDHSDSELPSGDEYFQDACALIEYLRQQIVMLDNAYYTACKYAYGGGSDGMAVDDFAQLTNTYPGAVIPNTSENMLESSKATGEETYPETRYTDIEKLNTESQVHKDMANRLRQLDYEFKEAVKTLNAGYDDDIECTVDLYFDGPYNPYNLRPGMRGDVYYNGKEYKGLMLTAVKINTSQKYFTLVFGAKRSTFYSTFKRA